jgi:hypothetical protein
MITTTENLLSKEEVYKHFVEKSLLPRPDPLPGTKYDGEKPRMDLLDAGFLEEVAKVLTFGAKKYAAHNWRGGISYSRLIAAIYRHLGSINRGEDIDPESGLSHAGHLGCCVMFLEWMQKNKPELDDRWKNS